MDAGLSGVDWGLLVLWGPNLLRGLLLTIEMALGAFFLGLLIGLGGAFGKIHGGVALRWMLEGYTTVIRAVPELVLIFLFYYLGEDLLNQVLRAMGYRPVNISGLAAGVFALGLVQGAYATEVLRGAMRAVPAGQIEAGAAFGMSWWQRQRRIVIPGMIPFAIPGLANLWLIVTKDTALLAVIGFSELAKETQQAAATTDAYFMFYSTAGALYLLLSVLSVIVIRRIERHFRRGQQRLA